MGPPYRSHDTSGVRLLGSVRELAQRTSGLAFFRQSAARSQLTDSLCARPVVLMEFSRTCFLPSERRAQSTAVQQTDSLCARPVMLMQSFYQILCLFEADPEGLGEKVQARLLQICAGRRRRRSALLLPSKQHRRCFPICPQNSIDHAFLTPLQCGCSCADKWAPVERSPWLRGGAVAISVERTPEEEEEGEKAPTPVTHSCGRS